MLIEIEHINSIKREESMKKREESMNWSTAEKRVTKLFEKKATIKLNYERARRDYIKRQFLNSGTQRLV